MSTEYEFLAINTCAHRYTYANNIITLSAYFSRSKLHSLNIHENFSIYYHDVHLEGHFRTTINQRILDSPTFNIDP